MRQELLDLILALRPIHQMACRRVVQPTDRLFLTPEGANHDQATTGMRRVFRRVLERAGIDRKDAQGRTAAARVSLASAPASL